MITQERLKELLQYNSETGEFFWKVAKSRRVHAGDRSGNDDGKGYLRIDIDGKHYLSHRLAWLYIYGQFPNGHLDHKNQNGSDNRITNLREATRNQNGYNVKTHSSSGLKGVYLQKKSGNWYSSVMREGKSVYLGTFYTPEEAHAAYCAAAKELHGEFFNPG